MKKSKVDVSSSFAVFAILGIASCLFVSFLFINLESTLMLLIFNLLFSSLVFHLKGTMLRKGLLQLIGNVIGVSWNYLLCQFANYGALFFGNVFSAPYMILSPFANLFWVVSFWSISLAALASSEKRNLGISVDS
jgi:hypothetical protein